MSGCISSTLAIAAAVAFGYNLHDSIHGTVKHDGTTKTRGSATSKTAKQHKKWNKNTRQAALAAMSAVAFGYYLHHLPSVVVPPHVPQGSPTVRLWLPPWPLFRLGTFLLDLWELIDRLVPPEVRIQLMAGAYTKSAVLYTLTRHNIIDSIGRGPLPKTCSQVAHELHLKEHAVCQFTRAGTHLGILKQSKKDGTLSLTRHGSIVHSDTPNSLRDLVLSLNEGIFDGWRGATTKSIISGESGIKESTGLELWEYYNEHPQEQKQFDSFMKINSFNQLGAIISAWKLPSDSATFCDIGGGMGHSMVQFLEHYPEASGIVFDRHEITDKANEYLTERGLSGRARALGGDIFQPFPKDLASCDVFFMKYIMHDWPDDKATKILENVKNAAAKPGAKVVLVDVVLDNGEGLFLDIAGSLASINMLAASPFGARERKLSEFADLFAAAGYVNEDDLSLKEVKLVPTRDLLSVIEVEA